MNMIIGPSGISPKPSHVCETSIQERGMITAKKASSSKPPASRSSHCKSFAFGVPGFEFKLCARSINQTRRRSGAKSPWIQNQKANFEPNPVYSFSFFSASWRLCVSAVIVCSYRKLETRNSKPTFRRHGKQRPRNRQSKGKSCFPG